NNLFDVKPDKLPAESAYLGFNQCEHHVQRGCVSDNIWFSLQWSQQP
ncbi:hypothetical protein, partial [Pseudomonas aeruginosa]